MKELAVCSIGSFGEVLMPCLRILHFHSLDAVFVAITWQNVFSLAFSGHVSAPHHVVALALVVWLVYTADRLLDARSLRGEGRATARHHHHRNRFYLLTRIWVICLACLFGIAAMSIETGVLCISSALGAFVLLYAAQIHLLKWRWGGISKELQVATLFALGITIDSWASLVTSRLGATFSMGWTGCVLAWLMMSCLFFLNCSHVSFSEHSHDPFQGPNSLRNFLEETCEIRAHSFLRWGHSGLIVLGTVCGLLGLAPQLLAVCVVVSSFAMQVISKQLAKDQKRQWIGLAMDLSLALPPWCFIAGHYFCFE